MNHPDLTPKQFIQRSQRQSAVRLWIAPVALCVVIAAAAIGLANTRPVDVSGQLAEQRIVQAEARTQTTETQIARAEVQLRQRERAIQAEQHLTKRPDWAAVLSVVARQFDGQSMMTGCTLGRADEPAMRSVLGDRRDDAADDSVWMIITGAARANSDVPGLIMRLEALGLFERVVLASSQRETFAGGSRTTFTLACKVR
jgi:hypothetical protein